MRFSLLSKHLNIPIVPTGDYVVAPTSALGCLKLDFGGLRVGTAMLEKQCIALWKQRLS